MDEEQILRRGPCSLCLTHALIIKVDFLQYIFHLACDVCQIANPQELLSKTVCVCVFVCSSVYKTWPDCQDNLEWHSCPLRPEMSRIYEYGGKQLYFVFSASS